MELKDFNLVMAFSGWPDAKRAATYAVKYLRDKLQAEKIGEMDSKPFYDFSIQRPFVTIKRGLTKDYAPPTNELYAWKSKSAAHDLAIFIGVEPNINWLRYVESILKALNLENVNRICLFGGLIDRIPHTVKPLISGVATMPELLEEMKLQEVEPVEYSGPSSIHSLILRECKKKGVPAISIWGHAPEYIDDIDPRTAHQLLNKAKALMGIEVDLEELRMEGNLLKKELDSLMTKNHTFSQLVHKLEIEYHNAKRSPDYIS